MQNKKIVSLIKTKRWTSSILAFPNNINNVKTIPSNVTKNVKTVFATGPLNIVLAPLRLCHYLMFTWVFRGGTETAFGRRCVEGFLLEIDVHLHDGLDVVSSCRKAGISDKTYYYWRKKFGSMGRSQLSDMRALCKGNEWLKKILTEPQLDKLILKESLDYLKLKAWQLMGCVRPWSTPVKSWTHRNAVHVWYWGYHVPAFDIKRSQQVMMNCAWQWSDWLNSLDDMVILRLPRFYALKVGWLTIRR